MRASNTHFYSAFFGLCFLAFHHPTVHAMKRPDESLPREAKRFKNDGYNPLQSWLKINDKEDILDDKFLRLKMVDGQSDSPEVKSPERIEPLFFIEKITENIAKKEIDAKPKPAPFPFHENLEASLKIINATLDKLVKASLNIDLNLDNDYQDFREHSFKLYKLFDRGLHFNTSLFSSLREAIHKFKGPTRTYYDVVIIGAGVGGTRAATILAPSHNVLVLDKSDKPSVFGRSDFYLLSDIFELASICDVFNIKNIDFGKNFIRSKIEYGTSRAPDSVGVSNKILLALFQSMAEISFNTEATKIERHPHGYQITTDKGVFYAKNIIVSTGYQGLMLEQFSDSVQNILLTGMQGEDPTVFSTEGFLSHFVSNDKEALFREKLKNKKIGVIGMYHGAGAVFSAILGFNPNAIISTHKTYENTSLDRELFDCKKYPINTNVTMEFFGGNKKNSFQSQTLQRYLAHKIPDYDDCVRFHGNHNNSENNKITSVNKRDGKYFFIKNEQEFGPFDLVVITTGYANYLEKLFSQEIWEKLKEQSKGEDGVLNKLIIIGPALKAGIEDPNARITMIIQTEKQAKEAAYKVVDNIEPSAERVQKFAIHKDALWYLRHLWKTTLDQFD